jgi:hypothetical protein
MMALFLGHGPRPVNEVQRRFEVWECEFAGQVMLIYDLPIWNLLVQFGDFLSFQRGNTPAAGNASLCG